MIDVDYFVMLLKRQKKSKRPDVPIEDKIKYAIERDQFLKDNPWCQVALLVRGEKVLATHVHHKKGRGPFFLDKSTFVATTRDGDAWIHQNPDKARELGLLE